MARVTVEDCVLKVSNRFELVMMAGQRARDISAGGPLTVDRDNDKNPVVALREIADETVELDSLRDALVRGHQRHIEFEETEEEVVELMAGEEDWPAHGVAGASVTEPVAEDVDEVEATAGDDADADDNGSDDDLREPGEDELTGAPDADDVERAGGESDDDPLS